MTNIVDEVSGSLVAGSAAALKAAPRKVFDSRDIDLLAEVSDLLLHDPESKGYPDVVSFAFWCRRGHLKALAEKRTDLENNMGRGLAFHVAPSNVPVNFAFSWVFALLAGNANVVRVPSKPFPQIDIICRAVNAALEKACDTRTAFVRYPSSSSLTTELSAASDARVIWGGDATVSRIRAMASKPRCIDVAFADRYSIAVIDAEAILELDDAALTQLARDFYNDTYLMDQNACSSPSIVLWMNANDEGEQRFWNAVHSFASQEYVLQGAIVTNKYVQLCREALEGHIKEPAVFDGLLQRVDLELDGVAEGTLGLYREKGGFFFESAIDCFADVASKLDCQCQTVTYYGVDADEIRRAVIESGCQGVDRIVPIGKAMDIDAIWDGMDLLSVMSRKVDKR